MKRTTYHHGNLRRVLLDASLALVNESGVAALSLREVARKAGVSHNAPYHHFPDKGSLLTAIAIEGFEGLAAVMAAERDKVTDPKARMEASGLAYMRFALASPAHFRVMFRPELTSQEDHPEVMEVASLSFDQVVANVVACQEVGLVPAGDPMGYVLTCWSAVHGLASLWLDGPLSHDPKGFGKSPEKLAQMVVSTLSGLYAGAPKEVTKKEATKTGPKAPSKSKPNPKAKPKPAAKRGA